MVGWLAGCMVVCLVGLCLDGWLVDKIALGVLSDIMVQFPVGKGCLKNMVYVTILSIML